VVYHPTGSVVSCPPARSLYRFVSSQVTSGAIPLLATMDIKLATSRRPAQAVGYPAQGRGADGDSGGTAGTPPMGVGAIGVSNSQSCEIPPLPASQRSVGRTKGNPRPLSTAGSRPGPTSCAGAPPDGLGPTPSARSPTPEIILQSRTFRIATWNMCGQLKRSDQAQRKLPFAERLLLLEGLDLLLLTETHEETLVTSPSVRVLGQSGMASKAGIALITSAKSSWKAVAHEDLVPGYAMITKVAHNQSREEFWLLGVYGNTSRGFASLREFLGLLRMKLRLFIASGPGMSWEGCLAVGDWNFVEFSGDRFPVRESHVRAAPLVGIFNDIRALCKFADAAGDRASPRLWSWSGTTQDGMSYSRIDRIYVPTEGWSACKPIPVDTNWSDHRMIMADITRLRPCVEKAVPAPRLPSLDLLTRSHTFWPKVLTSWSQSTEDGPMTLERWTAFKRDVLSAGLATSRAVRKASKKDWRRALKEEALSPSEATAAMRRAAARVQSEPVPRTRGGAAHEWPEAVSSRGVRPRRPRPSFVPDATSPWQVPVYASSGSHGGPSPALAGMEARPMGKPRLSVADILDQRQQALGAAAKRKAAHMAKNRTSDWFKQSSNKELDERGSRASVSVEGLRRPSEQHAHTDLRGMASVAREYFEGLHTPEPLPADRLASQQLLLQELREEYGTRPDPTEVSLGPFSGEEAYALKKKMPNTAPGPDGIPYDFWKRLASLLDSLQKESSPPPVFWSVLLELTCDLRARGTGRLGFKDANVSLFFKKGDPTLVLNYRPISSMNTDCKMYTNLVNARLAPWAVAKLHEDQKGFVPGRLMKEHTRLASEVAHLSDASGSPGYIVSLDQAKAYDRVDQAWLLRVLCALRVPGELVALIRDIASGCRSRIRVNSGYSGWFKLRRGVRQGDPLSCLLFNFSIEPLAMRLRRTVGGISLYGLPPVKVMLYADDINLFLSRDDSVDDVNTCLVEASYAIGSRFNREKTDVKPVGPPGFRVKCFAEQSLSGSTLPGAYILPPGSPLRILGVWIDSHDHAAHRWAQIDAHISRIIRQWRAIGASVLNRAALAKALMLSRCHFLLDGNGIPGRFLDRISNKVQRFVRGSFSDMAYRTLEVPLAEGGLNCPSLRSRKKACDLKFISELITGPQLVPWKQWTWKDIKLASFSSASSDTSGLNPFVQNAHVKPSLLQDRVRQAFLSAQQVGLDLVCAAPSLEARRKAPAVFHPAIPKNAFVTKKMSILRGLGIRNMGDVFSPPVAATNHKEGLRVLRMVRERLSSSAWSPSRVHCSFPPSDSVLVWPTMNGPLGCVRVFTGSSLLTTAVQVRVATKARARLLGEAPVTRRSARVGGQPVPPPILPAQGDSYRGQLSARPYTTPPAGVVRDGSGIILTDDIHVWTDGSALNNGLETCTAGAAWATDLGLQDEVSLFGLALSNNVAEVAAVVLCLLAWRDAHLVIHTDSSFVLGLVKGGLLAMERDGWGDSLRHLSVGVPAGLLQYALYLLRDRSGRLAFVKAKVHANDVHNNLADFLANQGRVHGRRMNLGLLTAPAGWVDTAPVLAHQPLDFLTKLVVRHVVPPPTVTLRFTCFSDRWVVAMGGLFGLVLDPGLYISNIWRINIPEQLREVLWREMNGTQVLGVNYHGKSDQGRRCRCGATMSLDHIFLGCYRYDVTPLQAVLLAHLAKVSPPVFCRSLRPDDWHPSPWYPLLALKRVERNAVKPSRTLKNPGKSLSLSRPAREWLIGTYFWLLWRWRMKEIHDGSFLFVPRLLTGALDGALGSLPAAAPDECRPKPALVTGDPGQARAWSSEAAVKAVVSPAGNSMGQGQLSRREAILRTLTDGAFD